MAAAREAINARTSAVLVSEEVMYIGEGFVYSRNDGGEGFVSLSPSVVPEPYLEMVRKEALLSDGKEGRVKESTTITKNKRL